MFHVSVELKVGAWAIFDVPFTHNPFRYSYLNIKSGLCTSVLSKVTHLMSMSLEGCDYFYGTVSLPIWKRWESWWGNGNTNIKTTCSGSVFLLFIKHLMSDCRRSRIVSVLATLSWGCVCFDIHYYVLFYVKNIWSKGQLSNKMPSKTWKSGRCAVLQIQFFHF